MIQVVDKFNFGEWMIKEMSGYDTIMELGAGFFNHLGVIDAPVKIGVELCQAYINVATFRDCHMICGNMIHYREITGHLWRGRKAVMLIDVLEHVEMPFALKLVNDLKEDFDKIVIMSPRGYCYQDKDVTGLGNDYNQTHKSFWFDQDIENLGLTEVLVDPLFHEHNHANKDKGCYFGIYKK